MDYARVNRTALQPIVTSSLEPVTANLWSDKSLFEEPTDPKRSRKRKAHTMDNSSDNGEERVAERELV